MTARFVLLVFVLLASLAIGPATAADTGPSPCDLDWKGVSKVEADPEAPLDARIGGAKASFETTFDRLPDKDDHGDYRIFECGWNSVSFYEDQYAVSILLFPKDRPLGLSKDESHDNDWTEEEALEVVSGFLPPDAKVGRTATVDVGYKFTLTEYKSDVMKELVPKEAWEYSDDTPVIGSVEVLMWLSKDGNVTEINIDLQIEDSDYFG